MLSPITNIFVTHVRNTCEFLTYLWRIRTNMSQLANVTYLFYFFEGFWYERICHSKLTGLSNDWLFTWHFLSNFFFRQCFLVTENDIFMYNHWVIQHFTVCIRLLTHMQQITFENKRMERSNFFFPTTFSSIRRLNYHW